MKELFQFMISSLKDRIKLEKAKLKKDPNNEFIKGRISAFELDLVVLKETKKDLHK